jgi:hypothetical protein
MNGLFLLSFIMLLTSWGIKVQIALVPYNRFAKVNPIKIIKTLEYTNTLSIPIAIGNHTGSRMFKINVRI